MKKSKLQSFLKKVALFAVLFFVLINLQLDGDFGWHVALGQYFLEHKEVLREDIFTWTMNGYEWGNSYVLYQILVAWLVGNVGYINVAIIFALLSASGFVLLVKEIDFTKFVLIILGAVLALANLAVRPHVFSFLFFSALLISIERKFYDRSFFPVVTFFVFALWANFHRGFVFAIIFFSGYLLLDFLFSKKVSKFGLISLFSAIAGSFVTPFPVKVWSGGVADDFKTWENLIYIAEWFPTAVFYPTNILMGVSGLVLVYIFLVSKNKLDPVWFLISAATFAFAFLMVNLLSFWSAVFVLIVSKYFYIPKKLLHIDVAGKIYLFLIIFLCGVAVVTSMILDARQNWSLEYQLKAGRYPVEATEYIKENQLEGNLFNSYHWGGYIIWKGEKLKPFIDGRMAGWKRNGVSILGEYVDIANGKCKPLEKYEVQLVLVTPSFNLKCFDAFEKIYEDNQAIVLLKKAD